MQRKVNLLSILLVLLVACNKQDPALDPDAVIVASVDDHFITETSFQRAYLPLLLYGDKFDSKENREEMANFLIGQKILADEGRKAELDTVSLIRRARERVERRALARQLYQEWVRKDMTQPTEAELREGFRRGKKSIFMRHLFAQTEAEIREYADRLKQDGENFYTLAQDVFSDTLLSNNGGALGWVTFGDLDETLEDTLYQLKPGQISEPVKSQYGWHILSMDDSQEELFITEDDYVKHRELIRKKIVERREQVLGKQVLNDFMSKVNIQFNRDITKQVWPIVIDHLNPENVEKGIRPEFSQMNAKLSDLRSEVLLTANGEPWTVSQILARLPELERSLLYGNLYVAASNIIRDEMLYREAMRLGLDDRPLVREEVRDQEDQALADTYVLMISDTLKFTPDHQRSYFESNKLTKYHAPDSLQIELFYFSDSLTAAKALYQLRNGLLATNPADERLWLGPGSSQDPLYRLTRTIAPATMVGPVTHQGKWTLVKLVSRKRHPLEFSKVSDRVLTDMENERFNTTRNLLLETLRPQHKISIDHERLNR